MKRIYLIALLAFIASAAQAQYRFAGRVIGFGTQYNAYPESWSAMQALGVPNVYPQYGDIDGAWTVADYGEQRDTLILGFDNNSPIDSIIIWETCGAGIIDTVYVKNPNTGAWVRVFGRKGQNYPSAADTMARILRIGFPMTGFPVNEVRIELAADSSTEWPEIDAVAIHPQQLTPSTFSNGNIKAATFDGVDDYYMTGFSTWNLVNKNRFSMSFWMNGTDTALKVTNAWRGNGIVTDANYGTIGFFLANVNNTGDSIYAYANESRRVSVGLPYKKDEWQHIALVQTDSFMKFYLNGDLYKSVPAVKYDSTDAYGFIEFGRDFNRSTYFKGSVDEVKLFNTDLSDAEILRQKYSIGQSAVIPSLIGYWQFEGFVDSGLLNRYTHIMDSMKNGGQFGASGTVLKAVKLSARDLQLFPNPNRGSFDVMLPESGTEKVRIRISDNMGRVVFDAENRTMGDRVRIDAGSLKPGIYHLQMAGYNATFIKE